MQEIYLIEYRDSSGLSWVGNYVHPTRKEAMKVAAAVVAADSKEEELPRVVHARVLRYVFEPEHSRLSPREVAAFN